MRKFEELLEGVEEGEQFVFADEVLVDKLVGKRTFAVAVSDRAIYFWNGKNLIGEARPLRRVHFAALDGVTQGRDERRRMLLIVVSVPSVLVAGYLWLWWNSLFLAGLLLAPAALLGVAYLRTQLQVRLADGKVLRWEQGSEKVTGQLQARYDQVVRDFLLACRKMGIPGGST